MRAPADGPTTTARVLRDLARHRLAAGPLPQDEPEYIKLLRAEGHCVLGGPRGYVILPAEAD